MTRTAAVLDDELRTTSSALAQRDPLQRRATIATVRSLRHTVFMVVLAVIALQIAFLFDTANLAASVLALAGNVVGFGYALRQTTLRRYPISSLILLGYTFSYFTLPPLGQLLGLHTIIHLLRYPVTDFVYAIAGLLALICGHLLYSNMPLLGALRGTLRKQFYGRLGFYRVPRLSQLWLMGAVGCLAVVAANGYAEQGHGIVQAVLNGLRPFVYMPYVTLLPTAWSQLRRMHRLNSLLLVFYSGALLILAMMVNSRAYLLMGFASLLIVYFYLLASGQMTLPNVRPRNVVLAVVVALVVTGPVTKLAMTMVLVRGERTDLTSAQLVDRTWATFRSGHVAQRYERVMAAMAGGPGVNENYFDNLFLNRLANLKFVDNAVINQQALRPSAASYFSRIEWQKVISILPSPLIDLFGWDADKRLVTSGSSGDFLLYAANGNPNNIGDFHESSLLVNLRIVFGDLWPLALLLLSALIFAIMDAWCLAGPATETGDWIVRFNPLVIGMMFSQAFFFTSAATGTDSIAGLMGVLMREWIQVGLLYAVVFWASRIITGGSWR